MNIVTSIIIIIAQGLVIVSPHNHQITQSGRAELNCSVCPTLTPMFTWKFTQTEAQETETVVNRSQLLSYQYTVRSGRKSQALIIHDAQWRHVGVYKCIADIDGIIIIQAQTSLDVLSELERVISASLHEMHSIAHHAYAFYFLLICVQFP